MTKEMKIEGVHVKLVGLADADDNEARRYVKYVKDRINITIPLKDLEVIACPDGTVDINYEQSRPFERIRRITGYLTGTLDSWNDSKRAEERDRVKHELEGR